MVNIADISLCSKVECTGCMACYSACRNNSIKMTTDKEGFIFPEINLNTCTACQKCMHSCPILNPRQHSISLSPNVYAAFAKDINTRTRGSSGGLFSVLALHVLKQDGCVVGAAFDENMQLNQHIIESEEELSRLQGSKYVQSNIGDSFIQVKKKLKEGKIVLFVGTPCQVDGLYSYLGKSIEDKLFTCDLVCHGVPSPGWFKKHIERIKNKGEKIVDFSFRDLSFQRLKLTIRTTRYTRLVYGYNSYFFSAFLKGLLSRECCYSCKYASLQRIGDITLADFWGVGKRIPFNYDKKHGVSLVLVNTNKGNAILSQIKDKIELIERSLEEAIEENHQLHSPSSRPNKRDTFFADFEKLSSMELIQEYDLKYTTRKSLIKALIMKNLIRITTFLHLRNLLMNVISMQKKWFRYE